MMLFKEPLVHFLMLAMLLFVLDHVFFSDPAQLPQDLLEQLQSGADHKTFGEYKLGLGRTMPTLSQRMLVGILGADSARGILAIDDDQWHGPFESLQGIHFVRIFDRTPEIKPVMKT